MRFNFFFFFFTYRSGIFLQIHPPKSWKYQVFIIYSRCFHQQNVSLKENNIYDPNALIAFSVFQSSSVRRPQSPKQRELYSVSS